MKRLERILRLLLLICLPLAMYGVLRQYLENAPVDNSIRVQLLCYIVLFWVQLLVNDA